MILSIESSCDDSSIALSRIDEYKLIFHQKISQDLEHSKYGGVVPELASRLHAVSLPIMLENLKNRIGTFDNIKAIAVTNEPGLSVSLLEGVMMAKALSLTLKLPLLAINHLQGHIYSLFINKPHIFPLSVLLLSGGHSLILEAYNHKKIRIIARTLDDSFGEAFDKVAKMLNLSYPGGPVVESYALKAKRQNLNFPIPLRDSKNLAFSFSGLKNAVRLKILELTQNGTNTLDNELVAEICYAFEQSAITHVTSKVKRYLQNCDIEHFGIVGGASANLSLRSAIESLCKMYNKTMLLAPLEFCSDNAAMIGRCAIESYRINDFTPLEFLDISPSSSIFV